jgi:hypothetical protein
MGTDLNTDFDEDEPYNREDSKGFIKDALDALSSKEGLAGIMADGGNAYTYQYVDHLLNVALDSSRFMKASNSIPFIGMVLHGYVQFTGTPINMEGDTNYAMLKAIENGASLYFIMSYRNTNYLKEFEDLSQYYSVNYSIWKEDVIKYYNELNAVMGDIQTSLIIDHKFITGSRVLDVAEIEAAVRDEMLKNDEYEQAFDELTWMEHIAEIAAARAAAKKAVKTMEETLKTLTPPEGKSDPDAMTSKLSKLNQQLDAAVKKANDTEKRYNNALLNPNESEQSKKQKQNAYNNAKAELGRTAANAIQIAIDATKMYEDCAELLETAYNAVTLLINAGHAEDEQIVQDALAFAQSAEGILEKIKVATDKCNSYVDGIYKKVADHQSEEDIEDRLNRYDDEEEEETEDKEEETIYTSNNGNIVAVTYGGKNGNDQEAYKTFILNYNNYAVTVKYEVNGETRIYTIPANEYVVVIH